MLKPLAGKTPFNYSISFNNSFENCLSSNRMLSSQAYEKLRSGRSSKISLLQINKEKIKKRNSELMKLFKQSKAEYINTDMLQKSEFMKTNELFYYLVSCLKKERKGLVDVNTIGQDKTKSPKPIEKKIKQFLYHSLQQSLLMSQKQIEESKYFERLFTWFTEVFKEREMKLSFKMESNSKKDSQLHDEEWIIRSTFKSSMPEEYFFFNLRVGQYQRKMLNGQLNELNQKFIQKGQKKEKAEEENQHQKENIPHENKAIESFHLTKGVQKKLYTQHFGNSSTLKKSNELLPVLNRKGLHSQLIQFKQEKQLEELRAYELEWKRSKAHFGEHLAKKYSSISRLKQGVKIDQKTLFNPKSTMKIKQNRCSFSLQPKIMDKIQAAKLGVTLTQFRKNKDKILQEKQSICYDSPVYHPYLTSNYFYDIKKKKFDILRKKSPTQFKYKQKNTDDSDEINSSSLENTIQLNENFDDMFNPTIPSENVDEIVENIDGLGLNMNPLEKNSVKAKKNEGKK